MDKTYAFYIGGIKPANIDDQAGIIRDVRLISEGTALGHDLDIDSKTIDQILSGCQTYQNGVKVKMNHGGGAGDIAGYVNNFRKATDASGEYLIGDLNLFANHPQRDYILELAKSIPDTFGLSCFFVGKPELVEGRNKARCSRVFSCDIVTEPAANPALFNIGPILRSTETSQVDKTKKNMTPEEFATLMEGYEKSKADKAAGSAAVVPTKETHQVNEDGSEKHVITKGPTTMEKSDDDKEEEEEMAARITAGIMTSLAKQGVRIAPSIASVETTAPAAKKDEAKAETFENICFNLRVKGDESGKKYGIEESVSFAIKNFPAEHHDYLQRCQAEGGAQYQNFQLSRAASKDPSVFVPPFVSTVEHWKVQGTPKPAVSR
jgi:hypothetical protein